MQALWRLLCDKWERKGESTIIEYINSTYSGSWSNWKLYCVPPGIPVHNNGLEGINGAFKINGTCRERSDLGTFALSVKAWLSVESKNADTLPTEPNVTPTTRRDAQLLASGRNSRVDFSMKGALVMKRARVKINGMADAWLKLHCFCPVCTHS